MDILKGRGQKRPPVFLVTCRVLVHAAFALSLCRGEGGKLGSLRLLAVIVSRPCCTRIMNFRLALGVCVFW